MTNPKVESWGECPECGHAHYVGGYGPACPVCDCAAVFTRKVEPEGEGRWRDGEAGPRRDVANGVQLADAAYLNALESRNKNLDLWKRVEAAEADLKQARARIEELEGKNKSLWAVANTRFDYGELLRERNAARDERDTALQELEALKDEMTAALQKASDITHAQVRALAAQRDTALQVAKDLADWLKERGDAIHHGDCQRYVLGLHFTQPDDCTCGLHAALARLSSLGENQG